MKIRSIIPVIFLSLHFLVSASSAQTLTLEGKWVLTKDPDNPTPEKDWINVHKNGTMSLEDAKGIFASCTYDATEDTVIAKCGVNGQEKILTLLVRENFKELINASGAVYSRMGRDQAKAKPGKTSRFISPDGRISVFLPTKPEVREDLFPSKKGPPYKRVSLIVDGSNYMLLAGILELGSGPTTTGAEEEYLQSSIDSLRGTVGNDLVFDPKNGTRNISLGIYKGKEINGSLNGIRFRNRSYVTPRRIYMLVATYDNNDQGAQNVTKKFFDSFKILAP